MNWLDHEYLVPVTIGNSVESWSTAKRIYKLTQKRIHVFAERISALQRFRCVFHMVVPWRDFLIIESLVSFAQSLDGYCFPVLISCDNGTKELLEKNSEIIESYYLVVNSSDISKY